MNIQLKQLDQELEKFRIPSKDRNGNNFSYLSVCGWYKYLQLKGIVKGDIPKEAKTLSDMKYRICDVPKFQEAENWKRQLDDAKRKIEYAKQMSLNNLS